MRKSAPDNRQLLVEHILNGQTDFYRLAVSYVKNQDAALDVVQEAIVKALSKVDTVREPAYLKTWFYRILINEAMNHFRRNRNLVSLEEVMVDRAVESGTRESGWTSMMPLTDYPFKRQTVIKLRYFEDMKLEEIAQATGANLNTVKSRLYKAIRKLKGHDRRGESTMHPEMERARARYHAQETPEELSLAVRAAIREGDRLRKGRRVLRRSLATALASCACFVLLVNGSTSFCPGGVRWCRCWAAWPGSSPSVNTPSMTMSGVIDVRLPALENTGHTELEQKINQEISTRIQAVIDEAEARARETKEAYVATGGDPKDYMPVIIDVDYEVKCQNEQYLSFVVNKTETRASAYTEFYTYNIDLETDGSSPSGICWDPTGWRWSTARWPN